MKLRDIVIAYAATQKAAIDSYQRDGMNGIEEGTSDLSQRLTGAGGMLIGLALDKGYNLTDFFDLADNIRKEIKDAQL